MITQGRLKEALSYCPRTGIFTRVVSAGSLKKGSVAGGADSEGYISIRVDSTKYKAHRLAWLYIHGKFPDGEVDHINGIKDDNRIENLRDVSRKDNMKNRSLQNNNTSGHQGIELGNGCLYAYLYIQKKKVSKRIDMCGGFDAALVRAIAWRDEQYRAHGFHENHGRQA